MINKYRNHPRTMKWAEQTMFKKFLWKDKANILNKLKEYYICLENIIKLKHFN